MLYPRLRHHLVVSLRDALSHKIRPSYVEQYIAESAVLRLDDKLVQNGIFDPDRNDVAVETRRRKRAYISERILVGERRNIRSDRREPACGTGAANRFARFSAASKAATLRTSACADENEKLFRQRAKSLSIFGICVRKNRFNQVERRVTPPRPRSFSLAVPRCVERRLGDSSMHGALARLTIARALGIVKS